MNVLIIGSLGGELGKAARIATARGAKLHQADDERAALARLRADARVDLVLVELPHDVGSLVRAMAGRAHPDAGRRLRHRRRRAVRGRGAIRDGAREFLPLPPDPDLIAAILEAASGESHALVARDPVDARHHPPRRAGRARPRRAS